MSIPFVLIVYLHFSYYYLPSRAYRRYHPFHNFESTLSRIPAQPPGVLFQNKGKVTAPIRALHYPTRPPPQHRALTHLPIITRQGKCRTIPRRRTPLEDFPIDLIYIDLVSIIVIFFIVATLALMLLSPSPYFSYSRIHALSIWIKGNSNDRRQQQISLRGGVRW